MMLSELVDFIWDRDTEACNKGVQIQVFGHSGEYQNLQLNDDKWQAIKWLKQFIKGDVELSDKIRLTPTTDSDSLDGHVLEFQGKKYKLQEVKD